MYKWLQLDSNPQPLSSMAKWLSVRLWTKWLWVRVQLQSLKLHISRLLRVRSSLTFKQLQSADSLWNAYVTWQEHTVGMNSFIYFLSDKFFTVKLQIFETERRKANSPYQYFALITALSCKYETILLRRWVEKQPLWKFLI